jgi:hypothetical protein
MVLDMRSMLGLRQCERGEFNGFVFPGPWVLHRHRTPLTMNKRENNDKREKSGDEEQ